MSRALPDVWDVFSVRTENASDGQILRDCAPDDVSSAKGIEILGRICANHHIKTRDMQIAAYISPRFDFARCNEGVRLRVDRFASLRTCEKCVPAAFGRGNIASDPPASPSIAVTAMARATLDVGLLLASIFIASLLTERDFLELAGIIQRSRSFAASTVPRQLLPQAQNGNGFAFFLTFQQEMKRILDQFK